MLFPLKMFIPIYFNTNPKMFLYLLNNSLSKMRTPSLLIMKSNSLSLFSKFLFEMYSFFRFYNGAHLRGILLIS
jgi:hypothetical protein